MGGREKRWVLIASDGRHGTLGRATDPTPEELDQLAGQLRQRGLAGWLAVTEGRYYHRERLDVMMVRPLAELPGATWDAAREAFLTTRQASLEDADSKRPLSEMT